MKKTENYTFFAEELFAWIIDDIKQKFNIDNPIFIVKNHSELQHNRELLINWINSKIYLQHYKWVKYKHLKRNIFELKEYFSCPPDDICQSVIDETIEGINSMCSDRSKKVRFKIGGIIYNEKEILFALRTNFSEIGYYHPELDPDPNRDRYICEINFQQDELGRIIPSGYMPLEQK